MRKLILHGKRAIEENPTDLKAGGGSRWLRPQEIIQQIDEIITESRL